MIDLSGDLLRLSDAESGYYKMSIWNRVLVGLIIVTSGVFLVLAVKTLAAHRNWQLAVQSYDKPLEAAEKSIQRITDGDSTATPPVPSIRNLEVKLHGLMTGRGKIWRGCTLRKDKLNPATLEFVVEVPFPDPHQIQDKMVLYLFEDREPGFFIGEYKVTGLAEKSVSLAPTVVPPTQKLLDGVRARIQGTQVTWSMYETVPGDRHDVFRGYDQNQLSLLMPGVPPQVLQEYLRDGSNTQPGDPPDRVINGKYERQLRAYGTYFQETNRQIASLRDQIAAAKTDSAIAKKLQADAEKEVASRDDLIAKTLKPELAEVQAERDLITAHRDALLAKLDGKKDADGKIIEKGVNQQIEEALAENKRLLAEWTQLQLDAAKRLEQLIERDLAAAASLPGE